MSVLPGNTEPFTLQATGSVARRQTISRLSRYGLFAATTVGLVVLLLLGIRILVQGYSHVDWNFFTSYPSRFASQAGLRSSILGTVWVVGATVVLALPIAVGTAVWLEEFAPRQKWVDFVRLNISNLAGVPSIIYGILGLTVFVRLFGLGPSIIAGALTLALMVAPITIIASSEAIRQVPSSIRDASLALGASKWQTVWHHVLPSAIPGIMTGVILSVSRAAGEAAALIMIGAFAFIAFDNRSLNDNFTVVPVQIYNWTIRPQAEFQEIAAAAIMVLMVMVVGLNLIAVLIRERFRKPF